MALSVSVKVMDDAAWWHPMGQPEFCRAMSQRGITWLVGDHQADVNLIDIGLLDIDIPLVSPTIIFDRIDPANVSYAAREFIGDSHLLGIIKPSSYTDHRNHNERLVSCSRLAHMLEDPRAGGIPKEVPAWFLRDRLRVVTANFWTMTWMANKVYTTSHPEKDFHAAAIFTCKTGLPFFDQHRLRLLRAMSDIADTYHIALATSSPHGANALSFAENFKVLCRSRAVVSPFGVVEHCFRDWEAGLAGCVLIKPRMYDIETTLPPWQNVVWCKPNFRDLDSAIEEAMSLEVDASWMHRLQKEMQSLDTLADAMATALKEIVNV